MAAAIKDKTTVEAELIPGGGGVFDVVVDGKKVFSKHETKRFPEHDEILQQLEA